MLNKQEQKILDNAPEWATHIMSQDSFESEYAIHSEGVYYDNKDHSHYAPRGAAFMPSWNPTDLADLRNKQGKTVADAVSYHGADASFLTSGYLIYMNNTWSQASGGDWDEFKVCTIEEFNQCVKEMSEFSGHNDLTRYQGFLSYAKQNSLETKLEPVKPVYTQAMKDAGQAPSVGMSFVCDDCSNDSRIKDFYKKEVVIIGTCHIEDKMVITFQHHNRGIGCGVFNKCWVKPIDTRTPEQKRVESIVQDIHSAMFDLSNETATDLAMMLQVRGHLADYK